MATNKTATAPKASFLSKLNLKKVEAARPARSSVEADPRANFIKALDKWIGNAQLVQKGEADAGQFKRSWFVQHGGVWSVKLSYGNVPMDLGGGVNGAEGTKEFSSVLEILNTFREAAVAGEMDEIIEAAYTKAKAQTDKARANRAK